MERSGHAKYSTALLLSKPSNCHVYGTATPGTLVVAESPTVENGHTALPSPKLTSSKLDPSPIPITDPVPCAALFWFNREVKLPERDKALPFPSFSSGAVTVWLTPLEVDE